MQRALNLDPNGKAPMSLRDLEAEVSEKEMQLALHLSREEAERNNGGKEGSRRRKQPDGLRAEQLDQLLDV